MFLKSILSDACSQITYCKRQKFDETQFGSTKFGNSYDISKYCRKDWVFDELSLVK